MLHPNLIFFGGWTISTNISSSNAIKAKKGQQSCMIIHRMTPIISSPLIYAAPASGARRGAVSQRDRNLCDQHENNIRLTRPSLICRSQWKRKKKVSKLRGLHAGSLVYTVHPSQHPPPPFTTFFYSSECAFSLPLLFDGIFKFGGLNDWTCQCWCIYSAAWVHICLFFSP